MSLRPLRTATALSLGVLIAFAGSVAADTARADGDVLEADIQSEVYLEAFAPGEVRSIDVRIVLTCTGTTHLDPGQTVTAGIDSMVAPEGGAVINATDGTVGPAPADWPADGTSCGLPARTFSEGSPSVVTLRAPMTPGTGYRYSLMYHRSIEPFGSNDPGAVRQLTAVEILLDVVANTPPTLTPPAVGAAPTVEADAIGGWTADWAGLGATDTEDDPDPTATCTPAAGTILPLGRTSVTCGVTDSGGMSASATFDVTVVDTTSPTLLNVPGDQSLTTGDPTGTTLAYSPPSATDVVDASPVVGCLPASGSHLAPGTTTVTCTATDGSGNPASDTFDVTVTYVAPRTASATWGGPISGAGSTFAANRGRTIPVKVDLFVDGVEATDGGAQLTVTPCGGGSPVTLALTRGSGRWNAGLDTTELAGSCHTVVASIDGLAAGSFRLELRNAEPTKNAGPKPTATSTLTPTPAGKTTSPAPTKEKPAKDVDAKPAKGKD